MYKPEPGDYQQPWISQQMVAYSGDKGEWWGANYAHPYQDEDGDM